MIDMVAMTSSEVRSDWSRVMDSVVHVRPAFIKRTRDRMMLCNIDTIAQLVEGLRFVADRHDEDDGSVTLSLVDLDIAVNEPDEQTAIHSLAADISEYADEYYQNYEVYSKAPNRRAHLPYVMKALTAQTLKELEGAVVCRVGKN